jgi:putative spermidine/putrescine transport system permease protein
MTHRGRRWLWFAVTLIGLWLFLPAFAVLPMSLNDTNRMSVWPENRSLRLYEQLFGNPQWSAALTRSFKIGAIVTVLAVVLGTLAALAIARGFSRTRRAALNAVILAPVIIPVVIAAIASYALFLQWNIIGSERALIFAHTSVAIPFVVIPVLASLRGINPRLEFAAQSLGASRPSAVWHVTLPLIRPGIAVGAFLAFMQSFDEVVLSLFLTGPLSRTLPVRMYSALIDDLGPTVAAAAAVIILFTTVAVVSIGMTRLSEARGGY